MTTHERAEKMVAERLQFRLDHNGVRWVGGGLSFVGAEFRIVSDIWSEAVRLQEELLKKEIGEKP